MSYQLHMDRASRSFGERYFTFTDNADTLHEAMDRLMMVASNCKLPDENLWQISDHIIISDATLFGVPIQYWYYLTDATGAVVE